MNNNSVIEIKDLSFSYGSNLVLKDINLSVEKSEAISIIGPSGFGKTTLLQLIAGDLQPKTGSIIRKGKWRRVFQTNALFPWLTVEENIKVGLRGSDAHLNFDDVISLLDLKRVLKSYPRELSGGQAQRTEIARAIIGRPDGLLLDEPFSSLDYFIRHETRNYLSNLLKEFPITMILVTHDIPEAISFTNKTYLINGRPASIIQEYNNKFETENLTERIWSKLKYE